MLISVANLTRNTLSTPVGRIGPAETLTDTMSPERCYRAAEDLKSMVDAGYITVVVTGEDDLLDSVEPAAVGTASVADLAVTTAKLAALSVTSAKLAADAVIAGKLADGAVDSTASFAAGVVDATALGALAVTTAKINTAAVTKAKALVFQSTEQTGTGSNQNIAHGLAVTPTVITWSLSDAPAGAFTVVPGTHTSTNVVLNATSGLKFYVFAWA